MNDLKSLLNKRVSQIGITNNVHAAVAIDKANEVLCELFGAETTDFHARAIAVKGRCIRIATLNPAFRQELTDREIEVIDHINKKLHTRFILSLKITI